MTFPSLTVSGSLSTPEYLLYRMVVLSPTFQAKFDDDIAVAAEHIAFIDITFTETRPVAVINTPLHGHDLVSGGSRNRLRPRGELALYLALDADGDGQQAELNAKNFFGGVIDDIVALSGADQTADETLTVSHLLIKQTVQEGFSRIPREKRGSFGDFYFAIYRIEWGD